MSTTESKMPLERAKKIADRIKAKLLPYCEDDRIEIAGSIRRQCEEVSDIEIVIAPSQVREATSLFGDALITIHHPELTKALRSLGEILKGDPTKGKYIKVGISSSTGEHLINCDIFLPSFEDYYRILAIRTGSSEYSKRIAIAWKAKGWVGTSQGLRLESECQKIGDKWECFERYPILPPKWRSELELFDFLGMKYLHPKQRSI